MAQLRSDQIGELLTVGEVARRSGVAVSALHFYEARGLIRSIRNRGNQRRFPRAVLRRVAIIKVAQRTGLSLDTIGTALSSIPADEPVPDAAWRRLSAAWKAELDARIARLTALRDQLGECIGCGCLSLRKCWLRNPLDVLSEEGSGPRLLDPD
jgi:MerR family redox-sensitive transcriptional activator SoxR